MSLSQFFQQHQRKLHIVALLVAVVLQWLRVIGLPLDAEAANAITFTILSYILFDISTNTYNFSRNKSYDEQADMYRDLAKYLDEKGAKEAILIQYSSEMVTPLLRKLMNKGAKTTLHMKSPGTAVSKQQKERIVGAVKNLAGTLRVSTPCKLTVYEYDVPASIRGVLIDGKVLAIGWYTYEHIITPHAHYPQDKVEISGHDIAGLLVYEGSPEFAVLSKMFLNQVKDFEVYYKATGRNPLLELSV